MVLPVNDDANPTSIESDEFIGQIVVRVKGLNKVFGYKEGQEQDSLNLIPESPWFSLPGGDSNLSSVQISGRFKREWPGEQVVFGVSYLPQLFSFSPCSSLFAVINSDTIEFAHLPRFPRKNTEVIIVRLGTVRIRTNSRNHCGSHPSPRSHSSSSSSSIQA